ncbi:MAG: YcgN family cysteine cluster protein [Commensalibacter sp.]
MEKFWEKLSLSEMDTEQWEALCDRCGRCCLHKLRDNDTDEVLFTNVACCLLDVDSGQCKDYENRHKKVPDCLQLTMDLLVKVDWLSPTCAYRLLKEGKTLRQWHPLISKNYESVHKAGISVRGRVISERRAGDIEDYIVDWPGLSDKD